MPEPGEQLSVVRCPLRRDGRSTYIINMIGRRSHLYVALLTISFVISASVISHFTIASFAHLNDEPEYAPIVERQMDFQDFRLKTHEGKDFDLRQYSADKKLLIVGFMAGWCKNSNQNGQVIKNLYDKYKTRGLGVVIVSEYSTSDEIATHINRIGIDYPIVVETTKRGERKKSAHYRYRRQLGDKRRWGTPFYVLVESQNIEPAGIIFARRVHTVSGEIVQSEAEAFIEQKLGGDK